MTLSRLNFTYKYGIIMFESNFIEALKVLEQVYDKKPFNLSLEVEKLYICKNSFNFLDLGFEFKQ
jgi:hypothetical protein